MDVYQYKIHFVVWCLVFIVGWSLILEEEDIRRTIIKAVVMKKHEDLRTDPS